MIYSSNELVDRYRAITENPAIAGICSLHTTIYSNEAPDDIGEEELLSRAKKNISSLVRRLDNFINESN